MSDDNIEIPETLLAHARGSRIVVMAGAGVSAGPPSSLPGWYELNLMVVSALCHRVDSYLERPDYTHQIHVAINARQSANLFPPDYQAQILEESCGEHYFRALQSLDIETRNSAHEGIAWLAKHGIISAVVTTNFDRLLEQAFDALDVPYKVAYEPKTYEQCLETLQRESHDGPLQILKVHGGVQDHRSLIDTLKQRLLGRNANLDRCLSHLLQEHLWLFVGFSAADLESDNNYLQLLPSAARSPGLTYVQWPGSKDLSTGARILLEAYASKASKVVAELDPFFRSICRSLGLPDPPISHHDSSTKTKEQVKAALTRWAAELHPAAAINCLAGIAEASGETAVAFQLHHRFWKDVLAKDRSGDDFELYHLQHGRLGIGGGILSLLEDVETTAGEESIQNLYRRGNAGDARAAAWAGLAWLWAGQSANYMPLISQASKYLTDADLPPEERVDVWLALAEAFYILGESEGLFRSWEGVNHTAAQAGDLPRQAKVLAITSFYFADFMPDAYQAFIRDHFEAVLHRAKRLNDPTIEGFGYLAQGRYLTKQRAGTAALEALERAKKLLIEAGRPPWGIFATIEYAKALFDEKMVEKAADVLNAVNESVDRYQVWLV